MHRSLNDVFGRGMYAFICDTLNVEKRLLEP